MLLTEGGGDGEDEEEDSLKVKCVFDRQTDGYIQIHDDTNDQCPLCLGNLMNLNCCFRVSSEYLGDML